MELAPALVGLGTAVPRHRIAQRDALRFLTVLREQMRLRIEMVNAEMAVYAAWNELEQACGAPLLVFPDEPGEPRSKRERASRRRGAPWRPRVASEWSWTPMPPTDWKTTT